MRCTAADFCLHGGGEHCGLIPTNPARPAMRFRVLLLVAAILMMFLLPPLVFS